MQSKQCALIITFLSLSFACQDQFKAKVSDDVKKDKTGVRITTTVHTLSELPVCDPSSQDLAGYVSPSDYFVKCTEGRWRKVTPGGTAFSYHARSPIRYYEWEDSIGKKRWSIPLENEVASEELVSKACTNGWKLPSKEELLAASSNGLVAGIKSHGGRFFEKAWTADFELIDGVSQRVTVNLSPKAQSHSSETKTAAGLYCVSFADN